VVVAKVCGGGEVETLVKRFTRGFNAGEPGRLDRAFAEDPDFRWYSTDAPGRRVLPIAADRSTLLRYPERRHAMGERLLLRSFQFNGNTPAGDKPFGNFQFRLLRHARDLPPTRYAGKGAAYCHDIQPDAIIVWSMTREQETRTLPRSTRVLKGSSRAYTSKPRSKNVIASSTSATRPS